MQNTRFVPTYTRQAELPAGAHFTLAQAHEDLTLEEVAGPATLGTIAGVCTHFGVNADLHHPNGKPAGWVRADGSYRVTETEVAA